MAALIDPAGISGSTEILDCPAKEREEPSLNTLPSTLHFPIGVLKSITILLVLYRCNVSNTLPDGLLKLTCINKFGTWSTTLSSVSVFILTGDSGESRADKATSKLRSWDERIAFASYTTHISRINWGPGNERDWMGLQGVKTTRGTAKAILFQYAPKEPLRVGHQRTGPTSLCTVMRPSISPRKALLGKAILKVRDVFLSAKGPVFVG